MTLQQTEGHRLAQQATKDLRAGDFDSARRALLNLRNVLDQDGDHGFEGVSLPDPRQDSMVDVPTNILFLLSQLRKRLGVASNS